MSAFKATPANALRLVLLFFLAVVALASFDVLFHLPQPGPDSIFYLTPDSYRLEGEVIHAKRSGNYQQLTIQNIVINDRKYTDRILVFVPTFPTYNYGDTVSTRCDVERPEPFDGFAYDRFLAAKGVYATCFSRYAPLIVDASPSNAVMVSLFSIRRAVMSRIDQTFGEPEGSLLAGLLLGEQRFSDTWNERFVATGTSHVVAASGYNVSIAVFLAFVFLTHVGVKRQYAFFLLLGVIAAYVVLAGAEAAVMRAGIMAVIVLFARQIGRKADMLNAVLLTACIMLAINPHLLRDDVGFQLSILSTFALLYAAPTVEEKLRFVPEAYGVRESLSATLAATAFTLPIILLSFGRISVVGPFANLFILPLIPYAMLFGSIAIVVAFVAPPAASVVAGPAWLLLLIILTVVKSLAAVPYASLVVPPAWQGIAAFSSILFLMLLWRVHHRKE